MKENFLNPIMGYLQNSMLLVKGFYLRLGIRQGGLLSPVLLILQKLIVNPALNTIS